MRHLKLEYSKKTTDALCRIVGSILMKLRVGHGVTIVNYHNPSHDIFDAHMLLFSKYFNFVGIDYLLNSTSRLHNPLLVTIDDGYAANYLLRDTIEKYGIPLLIYVVASYIDTKGKYWFDMVSHDSDLMKTLKDVPDVERRSLLKEWFDYDSGKEFLERTTMNAGELKAMLSIGCSIGSHTLSHPILTRCSEYVAEEEILNSKKLLSEILDIEVKHFAYPNGSWNQRVASLVKSAGYETARTISPGLFDSKSCLFQIPCYGISDDASPGKALLQATGFWSFSKSLLMKHSL